MEEYMLAVADGSSRPSVMDYLVRRFGDARCEASVASAEGGLLAVRLADAADLEAEATRLRLRKPLRGRSGTEDFDAEMRDAYGGPDGRSVDDPEFFRPFEKAYITGLILNSLQVDDEFLDIASKAGWQGSSDHRLHEHDNLILAAKRLGLLESVGPVHRTHTLQKLWRATMRQVLPDPNQYHDYFGEAVAFYYAWMHCYTLALVVPAILGAGMHIYHRIMGLSVDESPYVPLFSLFMVIWSACFVKGWVRQSVTWAHRWDTLDEAKADVVRPGFKGSLVKSPVTGRLELQYPGALRRLKYGVSALVTAAMLSVALMVMLMSLNLQGYVHHTRAWLYFPSLAEFSKPGGIFDPNSFPSSLIPTVIHVVVVQTLNKIYRRVAGMLTEWENHRTEQAHENSLILKRFFFEAFDSYMTLFYLAFYEMDVLKVRRELVSLFTVDCLRRIATEALLPAALQLIASKGARRRADRAKVATGEKPAFLGILEDHRKDEYEAFDDYLEMVIAFGYVTMFASAFPLASAVEIVYNVIELKSDTFKLCHVCRRPLVVRESGIGSWQAVLTAQVWLSVGTNMVLFAFGSDQMLQWFPSLFAEEPSQVDGDMDKIFAAGSGRYAVALFFALEHVLGLAVAAIFACVSDVPEAVAIAVKKREYERQQKLTEFRRKSMGRGVQGPRGESAGAPHVRSPRLKGGPGLTRRTPLQSE